ncbi:uncharacterized protein LOC134227198 [Armigeres subalbatus]|uniref:uncharacterized protein LOC134227198 n=1 Tax=Armigeres subalbatus TaxID=124917 RepID=UPI002ED662B4
MGSIGYIGGNIGYLGTGALNMDYPYEHGAAHYQLWKPPGNYFTRGEAPPPYEEAIALAQAESLNTCTVSVATSTQRQYPIAIAETETSQTITANTTNLINININNGGNLTAIATGENHVVGSDITPDIQTEQNENVSNNTNASNANASNLDNHESCVSFPTNYYTIPLIASEVCTNQNCDLNVGNSCNYSMPHASNVKEVQTYTSHNATTMSSSTIPKDYRTSERLMENCDPVINRTILPPPVFDCITNESSTANEHLVSTSKYRTTGKRYHRTIPRQFAAVDPIINPLKNNRNIIPSTAGHLACTGNDSGNKADRLDGTYNGPKRPACQCPVQHMPMTYLSSQTLGLAQSANDAVSTALIGAQASVQMPTMKKRISNDAARHVNLSHHTAQIKPLQISNAHSKGGTLRKNLESSDTSDRNVYSNGNYSKMQHFMTNDKALVDDQPRIENMPNLKKQNSLPRKATLHDTSLSMHKVASEKAEIQNPSVATVDTNMHISTIIQQQSSSSMDRDILHRKSYSSSKSEICIEPNPELPPKMYKHNSNRLSGGAHQKSYYSNSKTHAISKPSSTDGSKFSIPTTSNNYKNASKLQKNNYSKSLPRNVISASHEYAQASRSTTQFNNGLENSSSNINFNTLPKKTNKISTRSSNLLTEVVNKVPSVINIPSPLQPTPSPVIGQSAESMPVQQLTSIISSNNKRMQQPSSSAARRIPHQDQSSRKYLEQISNISDMSNSKSEKPLPVLTTSTNCANPKEHFLPNDNSLDDDYLSECENCKSAHGSRYYLEEEVDEAPQETMTLQRKMPENEEDQQSYYRVSSTLPTNTSRKTPTTKNRETWFTTIPASSSSDDEEAAE